MINSFAVNIYNQTTTVFLHPSFKGPFEKSCPQVSNEHDNAKNKPIISPIIILAGIVKIAPG